MNCEYPPSGNGQENGLELSDIERNQGDYFAKNKVRPLYELVVQDVV